MCNTANNSVGPLHIPLLSRVVDWIDFHGTMAWPPACRFYAARSEPLDQLMLGPTCLPAVPRLRPGCDRIGDCGRHSALRRHLNAFALSSVWCCPGMPTEKEVPCLVASSMAFSAIVLFRPIIIPSRQQRDQRAVVSHVCVASNLGTWEEGNDMERGTSSISSPGLRELWSRRRVWPGSLAVSAVLSAFSTTDKRRSKRRHSRTVWSFVPF